MVTFNFDSFLSAASCDEVVLTDPSSNSVLGVDAQVSAEKLGFEIESDMFDARDARQYGM